MLAAERVQFMGHNPECFGAAVQASVAALHDGQVPAAPPLGV
jgi:hypothetical protein